MIASTSPDVFSNVFGVPCVYKNSVPAVIKLISDNWQQSLFSFFREGSPLIIPCQMAQENAAKRLLRTLGSMCSSFSPCSKTFFWRRQCRRRSFWQKPWRLHMHWLSSDYLSSDWKVLQSGACRTAYEHRGHSEKVTWPSATLNWSSLLVITKKSTFRRSQTTVRKNRITCGISLTWPDQLSGKYVHQVLTNVHQVLTNI